MLLLMATFARMGIYYFMYGQTRHERMLPQTDHVMQCIRSKSCQLLHSSVGTTCTTEQIKVMELKCYS